MIPFQRKFFRDITADTGASTDDETDRFAHDRLLQFEVVEIDEWRLVICFLLDSRIILIMYSLMMKPNNGNSKVINNRLVKE